MDELDVKEIHRAFERRLAAFPPQPDLRVRISRAVEARHPRPAAWWVAAASCALLVVGGVTLYAMLVRNTRPAPVIGPSPTALSQSPTLTVTPTPSAPPANNQSVDAAIAVAAARGYGRCNSSLYDASQQLNVLTCARSGMVSVGGNQLAFFFLGSTYLGTDTSAPSAHVDGLWRTGDTVGLSYQLYRPNDPNCCPSGGSATVRFHWDGSRLRPLDPIPTSQLNAPLSRR